MFWVNEKQADREAKIRSFLDDKNCGIAVILAVSNFEWTLRRAIIGLSEKSANSLRDERITGKKKMEKLWNKEVKPICKKELGEVISNWNEITETNGAYDLRNVLVHGVQGTTGLNYAATRVEQLLDASNDLIKFCNSHNFDIYTRLPTGKSKKSTLQTVDYNLE